MKVSVINLNAESVGDIDLDDNVFGVDVRADVLARMVNWQLAKRRAGTHKVKSRSEVSATGRKPFKQKGTGRARAGSLVGTQYRGGGIAHGPTPRSHAHDLTKKFRKLGLKTALAAKAKEEKLVVLDTATLEEPKTKALKDRLAKLNWGRTLVIDGDQVDVNFQLAARNIIGIDVLPSVGANVYDIMRKDTLVLTKNAVEKLEERLK